MRILIFLICTNLFAKLYAGEEISRLYLFSEDVRDVVLKAPGGNPLPNQEFQLTATQSDQMKALAGLDDSMRQHVDVLKSNKKDCDKAKTGDLDLQLEKRVENRWFALEAVIFSSDKKFEQNALGRFMSDDYIKYMSDLSASGNQKAYDIGTISNLESKYHSLYPDVDLSKLSLSEKEKILNEFASSYVGSSLPSGLLMKEMAFQKLISNSTEWQKTLSEAKDKLSSEQKIALVSKLGGYMGNYYNYDRAAGKGPAANGYVDMVELLDSIKHGVPGGICRDIALAQTQMMKELGFTHNYVVAYKTLSASHAVVISEDPATGKIVKFNYGDTTEMKKGSGTEALIQATSLPDHGLSYNIYDTDGKPVTKVSSELSMMLKDSAGGDIEREFNQRNFKLSKVGFKSENIDGNIFTGTTSAGESLYGIALFKNMSTENMKLGWGASASRLEGTKGQYIIDQENLYLRANAELSSPKLKYKNTESNLFVSGKAEMLFYNSTETTLNKKTKYEAKGEEDASMDIDVGASSTASFNNGKTKVDSQIYASFYPDWNHVASVDSIRPAMNSFVVKSGVSHEINEDTRALIDTAVVMRNYGSSIVAKGVLEDYKRNTRYLAGASVPLSKDMPTFLPGGERRAFASVEKMSKRFTFGIEFERNFDNNSNAINVQGRLDF